MRNAFALMLAMSLVSCTNPFGSPEIAKCEEHIKSALTDPASYQPIQSDSINVGDYWQVGIEFSYVDDQGKVVEQAWQVCDYPLVDGKPDTSRVLKVESSITATSKSDNE